MKVQEDEYAPNGTNELSMIGRKRDNMIKKDDCPDVLKLLSLADDLELQVKSLRETLQGIKTIHLPELEKITSYEYVDERIIKLHRQETEELKKQMKEEEILRQKEVVERSLKLLCSNVPLSSCLRLVNSLRQQEPYSNNQAKLITSFLDARTTFITLQIEEQVIKKQNSIDPSKLFEAILRIMREPVFDVITQYRALFTDQYPLCRMMIERLEWFMLAIDSVVKQTKNTLVLATYWNQLVILNASYASIGAAFLKLLEPLFIARAEGLLCAISAFSLNHLEGKLGVDKSLSKKYDGKSNNVDTPSKGNLTRLCSESSSSSSLNQPETRSLANQKILQGESNNTIINHATSRELKPPSELANHPHLVLIANSFVELFKHVRVFSIKATESLSRSIVENHLNACQALVSAEQNGFIDQYLSPFISLVLSIYFPPSSSSSPSFNNDSHHRVVGKDLDGGPNLVE